MIYIDKTSTNITIPCNTSKVSNEYTLFLHGINNIEYEYTVTDEMVSSLYYYFAITLDIEEGEYNYQLISNGNVVTSGLLQYGLKNSEPTVTKKYYQRERIIKIYNR